ncbi:MAG TPA: hypothetical protein VFO27_01595, partial [Bryobacteraceae bacterium]|nr:hypothetical protein [Bryobacteraceae bacterium]
MVHFVGLDVSVKATSVCVVDDAGKVLLEQKVPTDPPDIIAILTSLGVSFGRIGIEAGPLLVFALLLVLCSERESRSSSRRLRSGSRSVRKVSHCPWATREGWGARANVTALPGFGRCLRFPRVSSSHGKSEPLGGLPHAPMIMRHGGMGQAEMGESVVDRIGKGRDTADIRRFAHSL